MDEKYVKLKHVKQLLNLIYLRDGFMDWTDEYEKRDKKVKNTIEWIERNAKLASELNKNDWYFLVPRVK